MKQVLQSPRTGELELADVPAPAPGRGQILVRNAFSLVSPGTERLALSFARKSLLAKARSRPDLARQVFRKLKQEGPLSTYRTVMTRLDGPQPLGYSSAGFVVDVGSDVQDLRAGDRVACAGAGYANHAEYIVVPRNLAARVPDGVTLEQACFSTLGAIALQGLRVAEPTLGEICAVVGLGLIGQLTVQLARANGCRVLAVDLAAERVEQSRLLGAEWAMRSEDVDSAWIDTATGGFGADFALVTAAASNSAPLELAAELARMQGRIVMVGAMPIELDRRVLYEKALSLRMSTSYGPGRYDRKYEEDGQDYPLPFVRWTENRNIQAFLGLVAAGSVRPEQLHVPIVPFDEAVAAYRTLADGSARSLATIFSYPVDDPTRKPEGRSLPLAPTTTDAKPLHSIGVGLVGAGNYAKAVLLPALAEEGNVRRVAIATASGASAMRTAERFEFGRCATDSASVLADPAVDLVIIATRHDSHARLAIRALEEGKAVWLEKPVGLSLDEVEAVARTVTETGRFLMVGYNRRFSSHAREIKKQFARRQGSLSIHYAIAAGPTPRGTWITDATQGGGRIVGEACHFVDLCTFLVGSPPVTVYSRALSHDTEGDDSLVSILGFSDGSTASIEYLARASDRLPKERFEVSADGHTARCENFRVTHFTDRKDHRTFSQDKGQATAIHETLEALRHGRSSPLTLFEVVRVSQATFGMLESARSGREVAIEM